MTTPAWPAELPCQPEQGTWQETPHSNVASFQPEVGPTIDRRRGTVNTTAVTCSFVFTRAEFLVFEAWFLADLQSGALAFSLDHPVTGAPYRWKFDPKPGWSMTAMTNRKVRVSAQLRRLP